jgi:hypothetical protein
MLPCLVLAGMVISRPVYAEDSATTQPAPVKTFSAILYDVQHNGQTAARRYWRAPDQWRMEPLPDIGATTQANTVLARPGLIITNATGHAQTQLAIQVPTTLISATLRFDGPPPADPGYAGELRRLRDLDIPGLQDQGPETVDGRQLLRYQVPAGALKQVVFRDCTATIWVDPVTKRPVSYKMEGFLTSPTGTKKLPVAIGFKDLRFNEPLDDALFTWPELKGKSIEVHIYILGPKNLDRDKLKLSVMAPDGKRLLSEADCQPGFLDPRLGYYPRTIAVLPEGLTRLTQESSAYVGQKLRVAVNDAPTQEVELPGPIKHFTVYLPTDPPAVTAPAATQPAR